jgi:hypothetical protein
MKVSTSVDHHRKFDMYMEDDVQLNVFCSINTGLPIIFCEDFELEHLKEILKDAIGFYELKRMSLSEANELQQGILQKEIT